jgi:tRNA(adenine34) deaminase
MSHLACAAVARGDEDKSYMQHALEAAALGALRGEVPVGAVLVRDSRILACTHNAPITQCDPTAHAEILALRAAASGLGNYRLPGTTLYVTLEPCVMCVGALIHARVARVVFACHEPKAGALGSVLDFRVDRRLNHRLAVRSGVCAGAARDLLQEFFRTRRGA